MRAVSNYNESRVYILYTTILPLSFNVPTKSGMIVLIK